jgi:hypothetical protein
LRSAQGKREEKRKEKMREGRGSFAHHRADPLRTQLELGNDFFETKK